MYKVFVVFSMVLISFFLAGCTEGQVELPDPCGQQQCSAPAEAGDQQCYDDSEILDEQICMNGAWTGLPTPPEPSFAQ